MKTKNFIRKKGHGFTLVEIMIALGVSGILLIGLTRLYSVTINSYSLQEQLTEMNQNAKFVIKEVTDILSESGASCAAINSDSTDKDTIIKLSGAGPVYNGFTIKINPRGGLYVVSQPCTLEVGAKCSLQVDNAAKFRYANLLAKLPNPQTSKIRPIQIYTLDSVHTSNNMIYISGGAVKDTFKAKDAFYSFVNHTFYLNGGDLCVDSNANVLAENVDSLNVSFYTVAGATAASWQNMRSVRLVVQVRTSLADNRYKEYSDHKRRIKLTAQFRLKNKV